VKGCGYRRDRFRNPDTPTIHARLAIGGIDKRENIADLMEDFVDILVATPRRLLELVQHQVDHGQHVIAPGPMPTNIEVHQ